MASLPQPDLDCSLVLRTDFSDDTAWDVLKAAIDSFDDQVAATYVNDPVYVGVGVDALVEADAAAGDDDKLTHLFLADATTMTDDEHRLLVVDLYTEPGHTFRLPPRWFPEVSANLASMNMDFADYADATDESGTFRGFAGE
jgi:uncharacterized protein DUF6924